MTRYIFLLSIFLLYSCINEQEEEQESINELSGDLSEDWQEWKLYTKDGCEIFVREMGQGASIVFLHGGWGAEHSYLIDGFKEFSKNYHLIFYDQRGSIRSPCQTDSVITVQNHVEDLEKLRKELKQDKLLLIGHSMGGMLAMNYVDKYPDKVKGLILIASPPAVGTVQGFMEDEKKVLQRWDRPDVIETLKENGLERQKKKDYTFKQKGLWHSITFAAINLHNVSLWKKMKGEFYYSPKAGMAAGQSMNETWDFTEQLKFLDSPIYVIHGDDDFIPISKHSQWTEKVEKVELKVVNKAGHISWIDQPEKVKNLIYQYLNKLNN